VPFTATSTGSARSSPRARVPTHQRLRRAALRVEHDRVQQEAARAARQDDRHDPLLAQHERRNLEGRSLLSPAPVTHRKYGVPEDASWV
jgi:hypothetical protein